MNRTVLSTVSLAMLVLAAAVQAAEVSPSRPYRFAVGASLDYTDNRDCVETDKTDNYDLSVWAAAFLHLERESRYLLSAGYTPTVRFRSDPSPSQNSAELYHDFTADGWYRTSRRVRFHLSEAFNRTDDPSVDVGGGTVRRDASFYLNRAGAGVETEITRLFRADVSGYSMVKRYSEDYFAELGDEDSTIGTASLAWILDRATALAVYGSYGMFGYPGDSAANDRGFNSMEAGVSFRRELSKLFHVKADLAYKRLDYKADELGSDQSPSGQASVNYVPSPRLRVTGSAGYVLRDSDIQYFASQRYTDVSLRAEWDALLPKRLTLALSGGYRMGDYKADSLLAAYRDDAPATSGTEKTTVFGVDATYRLKDWFAVSVVAQHQDVNSDLSIPFDRNSVGIRTRYDF